MISHEQHRNVQLFTRRGAGAYFVLENEGAAASPSILREHGPFTELCMAIRTATDKIREDSSIDVSLWIGEGEERTLLMPCADLHRIARLG